MDINPNVLTMTSDPLPQGQPTEIIDNFVDDTSFDDALSTACQQQDTLNTDGTLLPSDGTSVPSLIDEEYFFQLLSQNFVSRDEETLPNTAIINPLALIPNNIEPEIPEFNINNDNDLNTISFDFELENTSLGIMQGQIVANFSVVSQDQHELTITTYEPSKEIDNINLLSMLLPLVTADAAISSKEILDIDKIEGDISVENTISCLANSETSIDANDASLSVRDFQDPLSKENDMIQNTLTAGASERIANHVSLPENISAISLHEKAFSQQTQINELALPTSTSSLSEEQTLSSQSIGQDLFNKIQIMVKSNETSAKIMIDPPELGQLEIKITHTVDKMHITFLSGQENTKDLIETNIDKLRMQLEEGGLTLGNVLVSHQDSGNQSQSSKNPYQVASNTHLDTHEEEITQPISIKSISMLDLYA